MIDKIKLKAGSAESQPNLEFDVAPITIFVGPNNSGKSKLLNDIQNRLYSAHDIVNYTVLEKVFLSSYSEDEFLAEIKKIKDKSSPPIDGFFFIKKISISNHNEAQKVHLNILSTLREAQNPNDYDGHHGYFLYEFLKINTYKMDGHSRLGIASAMPVGDLKDPQNLLATVFSDDNLRTRLRKLFYEAFGKYYLIDHISSVGTLQVHFSDSNPSNAEIEKSLNQQTIDFFKGSKSIEFFSDGVRAYTGILTVLLAAEPKVSLIDEPEAFLHPSLAYRLGKEIGKILNGTTNKLFASTHSSNFLMGCVQSGTPLNVVRLTYKNNVATARLLPKEKILTLMRNPLLRSTGVLNGLFFEAVIVTESDTDRAFYQEINERLLSAGDGRGINNCLFLNAQNKQTVWEIVKPLRELGIPAAGIVDVDVIKEGGAVFSKLLNGTFIPESNHAAINMNRTALLKNFGEIDLKRNGGVFQLGKSEQEGADNFFNQLDEYGAFTVRGGELESWLQPLGIGGHGPKWLIDIFEKMGDNPTEPTYLNPTEGDVWNFIGSIKNWLENPSRKGIPL